MSDELSSAVSLGLRLSRRIYYGKGEAMSPPTVEAMEKADNCLPTAPMVYAVVTDPEIVDNPDIRSYQPYVHGRCDPPALIPLHMHGIEMEVDCYLDTAFVTVSGSWRVHCIRSGKKSDCRIAIPMGEQGSVLGVDIDDGKRSYRTEIVAMADTYDVQKVSKAKDGILLKQQIYTVKVPKVDGGSVLFIKVRWSQKVTYRDGEFCLNLPFSFPPYVKPVGQQISKREKIVLNVSPGTGTEVLCKASSHHSHHIKEVKRQAGKLGFVYEAEVTSWSCADFLFSYEIISTEISGGVLLQSPSLHDEDRRGIFCFYLFPGSNQKGKVLRREVVFVVDISGSMREGPLESTKDAILAALTNLNSEDSFNIIAFNTDTRSFSPSMTRAEKEVLENAEQWISHNFIADGGTNILLPINQALEMLDKTSQSFPLIFLITDGTVEDERHICNTVESKITANKQLIRPRICTFGIGLHCNHYFLQTLAHIGRGYYDAAFDVDLINFRIQRLFNLASSISLANVYIDIIKMLECIDSVELFADHIPDLSSESPLIVAGRYHGNFPRLVKARGVLPDMSNLTVDLRVHKAKDIPLDRVFARRQIDYLTARAWVSGSKQIEKITTLSIQTGVPSEYSYMILVHSDKGKENSESNSAEKKLAGSDRREIIFLRNLGIGFGNLVATVENRPSGIEEVKLHETSEMMAKIAANCCSKFLDRVCCMCLIRACSSLNDKCVVTFTQLCTALACLECLSCCSDVCVSCDLC